MKKTLFFFVMCLAAQLRSQDAPTAFNQGANVVSFYVGLPNVLLNSVSTGWEKSSASPSFILSYERGITDKWGVGGFFNIATASVMDEDAWGDTWGINYTMFCVGAQGSYHFITKSKFDFSAQLKLGYLGLSAKAHGGYRGAAAAGGIMYDVKANVKYFFTKNFGATAGLGYGLSILDLGLSAKF